MARSSSGSELPPGLLLTQFGRRGSGFRSRPRGWSPRIVEEGVGVSLSAGEISLAEIVSLVAGRSVSAGDGLRRATVERLVSAGSVVTKDPQTNPSGWAAGVSEQIAIQLGAPPWRPTSESELLATLRFSDGPLAGVLRQAGMAYHFACVEGHADLFNLWSFVRLEDQELGDLADDASEERLETATAGRPFALAVAREGHGIVASASVEDPKRSSSPLEAVATLMRGFEADLESIRAVPLDS